MILVTYIYIYMYQTYMRLSVVHLSSTNKTWPCHRCGDIPINAYTSYILCRDATRRAVTPSQSFGYQTLTIIIIIIIITFVAVQRRFLINIICSNKETRRVDSRTWWFSNFFDLTFQYARRVVVETHSWGKRIIELRLHHTPSNPDGFSNASSKNYTTRSLQRNLAIYI